MATGGIMAGGVAEDFPALRGCLRKQHKQRKKRTARGVPTFHLRMLGERNVGVTLAVTRYMYHPKHLYFPAI